MRKRSAEFFRPLSSSGPQDQRSPRVWMGTGIVCVLLGLGFAWAQLLLNSPNVRDILLLASIALIFVGLLILFGLLMWWAHSSLR